MALFETSYPQLNAEVGLLTGANVHKPTVKEMDLMLLGRH